MTSTARPGISISLRRIFLMHALVLSCGTFGYHLIEGWDWLDSVYMSLTTVTTVGFGEVHPLSSAGRVFTMGLLIVGVGAFTYTFGIIADYIVEGALVGFLAERRRKKTMEKMQDHFIICGYGRVGHQVATEIARSGKPVVVIESRPEPIKRAEAAGFLVVDGDAGQDEVLQRAGIARAKGLVATLDTDASNILVVLSARSLKPDLFIVARANYDHTENKVLKAGADRVISPYSIGGRRMAHLAVRPNVVEFLDTVMHGGDMELFVEDLEVVWGSKVAGKTIGELGIREKTGANVLGIKDPQGRMNLAPGPATRIEPGGVVLALGTREQLTALAQLIH